MDEFCGSEFWVSEVNLIEVCATLWRTKKFQSLKELDHIVALWKSRSYTMLRANRPRLGTLCFSLALLTAWDLLHQEFSGQKYSPKLSQPIKAAPHCRCHHTQHNWFSVRNLQWRQRNGVRCTFLHANHQNRVICEFLQPTGVQQISLKLIVFRFLPVSWCTSTACMGSERRACCSSSGSS